MLLTPASVRMALRQCYTPEDIEDVYNALLQTATNRGPTQVQAAKLLLEYLIGKPSPSPETKEVSDVYSVQAEVFGDNMPVVRKR